MGAKKSMMEKPSLPTSTILALAGALAVTDGLAAERTAQNNWLKTVLENGYGQMAQRIEDPEARASFNMRIQMLSAYACTWNRLYGPDPRTHVMDEDCTTPPPAGTEFVFPEIDVLNRMALADAGVPLEPFSDYEKAATGYVTLKTDEQKCADHIRELFPYQPAPFAIRIAGGLMDQSPNDATNLANCLAIKEPDASWARPAHTNCVKLGEQGAWTILTRHLQ